jgi:hypothetical protein
VAGICLNTGTADSFILSSSLHKKYRQAINVTFCQMAHISKASSISFIIQFINKLGKHYGKMLLTQSFSTSLITACDMADSMKRHHIPDKHNLHVK